MHGLDAGGCLLSRAYQYIKTIAWGFALALSFGNCFGHYWVPRRLRHAWGFAFGPYVLRMI